jgi:predicted extracellular nuclease
MSRLISLAVVLAVAQIAGAGPMQITEWMYQGASSANTEFIEFTNTGAAPVDMAGWSFDDSDPTQGTTSLSAFGVVAPGQSVILTEMAAGDFLTRWGLSGVSVIGGNANNLGRNDQINLYDATSALVDQLSYGDQDYPGTPRTNGKSCNIPASDYGFTTAQTSWTLASTGDIYGSWTSTGGDVGSPGRVPEPATLVFLALAVISLHRRWR